MEQEQTKKQTVEDVRFPEDRYAELINGKLYDLDMPGTLHQAASMFLCNAIYTYLQNKGGEGQVFAAPLAVYLDEYNCVIPDISVICDRNRLDEKGCHGAPDWIIEIVSPNTFRRDYIQKLDKYYDTGVRLYWMVNPARKNVTVWYFEREWPDDHPFGEEIPVDIFPGFSIVIPDGL